MFLFWLLRPDLDKNIDEHYGKSVALGWANERNTSSSFRRISWLYLQHESWKGLFLASLVARSMSTHSQLGCFSCRRGQTLTCPLDHTGLAR